MSSHRKLQYVKAVAGGGGEENKNAKAIPQPDRYSPWGELGGDAKSKGWYPVMWNENETEYKNVGQNNFNQVEIPNQKEKGYISVVGNKNGRMSVMIKKADGSVDRMLLTDASPQDVDMYFRNQNSTLQNRTNVLLNKFGVAKQ